LALIRASIFARDLNDELVPADSAGDALRPSRSGGPHTWADERGQEVTRRRHPSRYVSRARKNRWPVPASLHVMPACSLAHVIDPIDHVAPYASVLSGAGSS
jgi:hypothetical protein